MEHTRLESSYQKFKMQRVLNQVNILEKTGVA